MKDILSSGANVSITVSADDLRTFFAEEQRSIIRLMSLHTYQPKKMKFMSQENLKNGIKNKSMFNVLIDKIGVP